MNKKISTIFSVTRIWMLSLIAAVGILGLSSQVQAQCTSTGAFGSGAINLAGTVVTLTTCAFGGEYSTITGITAGMNVTVTGTGGAGNYLTVRHTTSTGTVVIHGFSPLTFSAPITGTYYLHYHTSAACGTDGSCHTGTVQLILPPCSAPTDQATAYVAGAAGASTLAGSFTLATSAPSGYLVVRYPSGATPTNPVNGTTYTAGNALGLGTVVQSSALTSFNATGLTPSTTYDFYIYSYNNTACTPITYLTTTPLFGSGTTLPPAPFISTALGGLWSSPATWVGGIVPAAANDVTIDAGATVVVDQAMSYNNLTVNGRLQWNASVNNVSLTGNLTIGATGVYLPYTTGGAAVSTTLSGNFTNDGFANMSLSAITFNRASGTSTLGGSGSFTVDQNNKGMFGAILMGNSGTLNVTTSQNLVCRQAMANLGTINPGGKLSLDVTSVVYGQAFNLQVASVAVTNMGSAYATSPVVTCSGASRWLATTAVTAGQIRFAGTNVYTASAGGTTSATAPTHTSGTATDGTVTWLWVGNTGTIGNAFQTTTPTVGTMYFYGGNLYVCTVTGTPSAAAPPVHTSGTVASGTASYRYVGSPATCSVNYDATTLTVRSLTLTSPGSGYSSAPAIVIASADGTGTGSAATATLFTLVGNVASATFNQQIGSGSTITSPFTTINNSQGVNSISVATGGVNYTVAPSIGFGFPTSYNLVTAGGTGYTSAPTVTVTSGTNVTGFTNPTFTVTVNQGKVVSVYCSGGGSGWLTPPTLTLTGGGGSGATCAFVAGSLATATANIGTNGQITSFTITNAGSGYVASPTTIVAGGTFTTAAATPVSRIGLYNVNYSWFGPIAAPSDITTGFEIPADRRMNGMTIGNSTNTVLFSNNLTLTSTAPTTWTSGMVNLGGNTLTYTWNGYAGINLISPNFGIKNGSITLTGRGGGLTGSTWTFPFVNGTSGSSLVAFTGTGSSGLDGSDITSMTVTETGAPSGGSPGNAPIGSRAFRVQTPASTTYGTSANVNMRWNPSDAIDGTAFPSLTNQSDLFVGESSSLTGPTWTIRSAPFGISGLVPTNGALGTLPSAPGPIANTTSKYYAYINTQVAPTITTFSPSEACADAGIITITGTGFKNITAASVTIGGTPVASIVSFTSTQIIARVGSGTTGPVAVTTSGGTATSVSNFTVTTLAGLVTPILTPSTGLICVSGGSVAIDATQTGAVSYAWTGSGLSSSSIANPSASPSTTTQYRVDIDMTVCTASYFVNVGVLPPFSFTPTSSVDTICFATPSVAVNMNANLSSSGFTVTPVPYVSFTPPVIGTSTLVQAGVATPALTSGSLDDGGWQNIPLGFSYNFFGNVYTSVNVGTNGVLQFGTYNATSLGDFTYATPFPTTSEPTNVIALMANDLWFNNAAAPGSIKYWNDGIAPTRRFFIQYSNVNTCCAITNPLTTVTAVLYETIGNVEIHVTNTNSINTKTIGLQDLTGTIGAVAPGRGSFTGTITTPEAWKFVPPASYTYAWTGTGLSSTTIVNPIATISTSPTSNYTNYNYSVVATNPITGCSATGVDSFKVFNTPSDPTATNSTECSNPVIPTCSVTSTNPSYASHTFRWYDAPTLGTLLQSGSSTTYLGSISATDTFYVSEINGFCESARVMVYAVVPNLVVTTSPSTRLICTLGGSVTLSVTRTMPGSSLLWTGGVTTNPTGLTTVATPSTTTNYTITETLGACLLSTQVGVGVLSPTPVIPSYSPVPVVSCVDSIQLNSNLSAAGFTVTTTPYLPYARPLTGVTTLCTAGTLPTPQTSGTLDDGGWGAVPIGFNYNFLGSNFNTVNIGTNGVVQFGPYNATSLGDFTYVGLPSTTEPFNIIAGCATDLYLFTSGSIRTWTTGISPLRKFVIEYDSVPGFTTNGIQTFQIVLYETTGLAEVHMAYATKVGDKTIGTNNGDGTVGATAPGRNAYNPAITAPESWRFNPPAAYTYSWTPTTGLTDPLISTPKRAPIVAPGTYTYSVAVTNPLTGCPSTGNVNIIRSLPVGTFYDTITATGAYLFNGNYYSSTGTYFDTVVNGSGCDSIVALQLAVIPNPLYSNDNACSPINVSPVLTLGSPYLAAGYASINTHVDTFIQSNFLATVQAGEPIGSCGSAGLDNRTMWYKFTMPFCSAPQVHISSDDRSNTDFDTRISVYRRSAPFLCTSPFTEVACSDNDIYYLNTGATTNSAVVLTPNNITPTTNEYMPGEDLYVQVSGVGPARGNYGLIVDVEPYVPTATAVTAGSATIDWSATSASTWGSVSGAYIQWRPVGSTSAGTYRYVASPANTTTITGLIPGTAYEYWASYVCGNGGRWWTRKGTFTTSTTCTGTSPVVVSVVSGTPCNRPVVSFDATASGYTSYRVMLRRVGGTNVSTSGAFYSSPSTQTYTTSSLVLGGTYQFWVVAFCGTDRVDSSAITTFTVCSSLRSANPNVTEATDEDQDVAYVLPNGDVVYGVPFNAMDLQIDVTNPNAQEITLGTIDANTYFGRTAVAQEVPVASVGDLVIYPNPATTEATLSYSLTKESTSMNIRIVDAQGKEMLNEMVSNPTMEGTYNINLNNYSAGVYFVKVQAGDYIQTKKLIVDRR